MTRLEILAAAVAACSLAACATAPATETESAQLREIRELVRREVAIDLRAGMPADIQAKIRAMGPVIDPPGTNAFYEGVERWFSAEDVNVSAEMSYGPDPRHLLQVYTPRTDRAVRPRTTLVLVHGGGFVGGSLQSLAVPAIQFAGLGFTVVNITYPLAPDAQFPAGPLSVGAAMTWARDHAAEYGGDPNRIFVLGASAGATHVADYVFRPSLLPEGTAVATGAILYSPNFVASTTAPSPYYGDDVASVATKLVPGDIERTSIPVLTTVTEFDPTPFQSSAATLYDELVNEHGVLTRLRQLEGHNHISVQLSIGTSDAMFVEEVLDFIAHTPSPGWSVASQ